MAKATAIIPEISRAVTCPFCALLCDDLAIRNERGRLTVLENGCPRARAGFQKALAENYPRIKGKKASMEAAVKAIKRRLKKARAPLIAGLGVDAGGMRQIMRLADHTGAILDHMHGDALIRNTLVLQQQGWISATLAEIKNRADLIVFAGADAGAYPRFFERVIWNSKALFNAGSRELVYIGDRLNTRPGIAPGGERPALLPCKTDQIGEIFSTLRAILAGVDIGPDEVAGIRLKTLRALAEKMKAARYGMIVWSAADLDIPHAELTIQSICELVKYLTRFTRFAGFPLSGADGAATAHNICAWQSGYPLRVSFNKGYPDYDAHRYSTDHVLQNGEADALLWVSSFGPAHDPPRADLPTIVLATPDTRLDFTPEVFIPVATPGVDHGGQLFRADHVVALPLKRLRHSPYISVGALLEEVTDGLGAKA